MATVHRFRWLCGITLVAAVSAAATSVSAADPAGSAGKSATPAAASPSGAVDMFDAMNDGDLGVQFIPHDAREATLILTNNTDQPLNVHLPAAFAAIPVLAQFPPPGGRGQPAGPASTTTGKKNQALGTGTKQQNQGQVGFGGAAGNGQAGAKANALAANGANAGAFSIPPERVVKLKLPTVCLEFGNAEPNAHVPYTVVPIDSYTPSGEVQELCRMLGTGTLDQQAVQAAAWHLANHMSWEKLADLKHFPHNSGFTKPVFSKDQIHAAEAITDKVIKAVAAQPAATPPVAAPPAKSVGLN
jgi:hypothetical protein